ncbi:Uncharacterised protein [Vibrio cholerae]|nr:Uncharacterised protein [Vibrio cholerae]
MTLNVCFCSILSSKISNCKPKPDSLLSGSTCWKRIACPSVNSSSPCSLFFACSCIKTSNM